MRLYKTCDSQVCGDLVQQQNDNQLSLWFCLAANCEESADRFGVHVNSGQSTCPPSALPALLTRPAAASPVLACKSIGPHNGGFLPSGDNCDGDLLTRTESGSMSLVGKRVGVLVTNGPT